MTLSKKSQWPTAALLLVLSLPGTTLAKTEESTFGHPGIAAKADRTVKITALDTMRFIPATVRVRPGETVRFVVTNEGHLVHEFILGDRREQAEHEKEMQRTGGMVMPDEANGVTLQPGQTRTLIWTFGKAGKVEYACHQPGHYGAGMVGKILVQ